MSGRVDIAVVGGGAAGIAAAVNAARAGTTALLLDRRPALGGTGAFSGLTTLCGLYSSAGDFLNEGFSREFAQALNPGPPLKMGKVWVLPYRPEKFRAVAEEFLASLPSVQARGNTALTEVMVEGDRIARINGLEVEAVVDCSGSAEVARAIDAACLETDETTQAPAILFPLRHVARPMHTPAQVAQVLLPLARAGLPPLSFQPSLEPETVTVKFTGRPHEVGAVLDFLRTHVSGFENCQTPLSEFIPAQRAGRMVRGQYLLTGADVLAGQRFADAVARCAWPIEQWSQDGLAHMRYLPEGAHYEIPARSLRAAGVENLFMAGKTISADAEAIASARVMGCCLATGSAAGQLAASYVHSARTL